MYSWDTAWCSLIHYSWEVTSPVVSSLTTELNSLATATTACHGPQLPTSRSNVSVRMQAVVGGAMGEKAVGKHSLAQS